MNFDGKSRQRIRLGINILFTIKGTTCRISYGFEFYDRSSLCLAEMCNVCNNIRGTQNCGLFFA